MAEDLSRMSCEERLAAIRDCVSKLARNYLAASDDTLDNGDPAGSALAALARIGAELEARRSAAEELESRLSAIMDMMVAMAALDFSKTAPVGDDGSMIDALATAANLLSEELCASVVSKAYVGNIIESMIDPLIVIEPNGMIRTLNRAVLELSGYQKGELIGQSIGMLFAQEAFADTIDLILTHQVLRNIEKEYCTADGRKVPVSFSASVMHGPAGEAQGIVCVARDITERKQAEEALRQSVVQEEIIRAQSALLAELSTPLIPLNDHVMVMPLIGTLDSRRVQQVLESLLSGVAGSGADIAILDITGVSMVDTQVANALIRAAQAVKLLGARVMLTGIRPEVAQTLVGLGVDLSGIATHSSLQSGIAAVMARR
jgi:rsbT co-antagonist protein RsbR